MKTQTKQLIKTTFVNIGLATCIFAALLLALWIVELLFPSLQLLKWHDAAWCVGIPASIIGVAYILTIKDPQNYVGFYPGILMSVLLGVQFFLQKQYDSTLLYFCVFIPFQVMSIINWKKPQDDNKPFAPTFLSVKGLLLNQLALLFIVAADYLLATYVINHDGILDNFWIKLFNGLLIASSVLANFWLIYRKNDAWRYWVVYSISGIILFIILGNIFSIVLFIFFLVINAMAGIAWYRSTPADNKGWVNDVEKRQADIRKKIRRH